MSGRSRNRPVMLPPGRAMLAAQPFAIGSDSRSCATIGMVAVALRAARTAAGVTARMARTPIPTSSVASAGSRPGSPAATRETISMSGLTAAAAENTPSRNGGMRSSNAAGPPGNRPPACGLSDVEDDAAAIPAPAPRRISRRLMPAIRMRREAMG